MEEDITLIENEDGEEIVHINGEPKARVIIKYQGWFAAITELECRRIERGERPLWGPLMGQDLYAK